MYRHILIATDGSELGKKAIQDGIALAKALGAKVTGVTVTAPWHTLAVGEVAVAFPRADYDRTTAANAAEILGAVSKAAAAAGLKSETVHAKEQLAYEGIVGTAKAKGCDLIVVGSHGARGLAGFILGSQAQKVLTHTDIAVLVVR